MKKFLLLVFVLVFAFVVINRRRVYVRDPLATVYRDDVKQSGVQVYINYTNDVLLMQDAGPLTYRTLVQAWNKMPGTPPVLRCLHWTACLADADQAATVPLEWSGKGKYVPEVAMTDREVSYVDGGGGHVRVTLR